MLCFEVSLLIPVDRWHPVQSKPHHIRMASERNYPFPGNAYNIKWFNQIASPLKRSKLSQHSNWTCRSQLTLPGWRFHSVYTEIEKQMAVTTTNAIKQYQTSVLNGNRNTLSVYESFGARNTKRDPVGDGIAMYCMSGTRSIVINNGDAPSSASLRINSPTIPLQFAKHQFKNLFFSKF